MPEIAQIAPCPFCEEKENITINCVEPYHSTDEDKYFIGCSSCYAEGPKAENKKAAITAWNSIPRSVKLPDEKGIDQDEDDDRIAHYVQGYNEAISEIKKLNPHLKFEE